MKDWQFVAIGFGLYGVFGAAMLLGQNAIGGIAFLIGTFSWTWGFRN